MNVEGAQRVALLGGSFDPPHFGHLAMARAARERLALDVILLTPTGLQPFKRHGAEAGFADRLAMTELLCAEEPEGLRASAIDAPRSNGAPNYTVDTVETMREAFPGASLFVILGADSFAELPHWREAARLIPMAEWIVVSRPGFVVRNHLAESGRVHVIDDVDVPLASRELRARLRLGEPCEAAIPAAVLRYIRDHGLYRTV